MPKKTYNNLSIDRKNNFENIVMNMFVKNKYDDIGIRDIAQETGISVGLFYKYFVDKDEMYLSLFSQTEKKIILKEKEKNKTFFSFAPYIDLEESLTDLEIKFNRSFYETPRNVKVKFFYDKYAEEVYMPLYSELISMKNENKLSNDLDIDFIYHIIITSMFDFITYAKKSKLYIVEDIIKLKKDYYINMVFKGILSDEFYSKLKKESIENEDMNIARKFFPDLRK